MKYAPVLMAVPVLLSFLLPLSAAVIKVDSLEGSVGSTGNCTFFEAIQAANANSAVDNCAGGTGSDEITFIVSGTILMQTQLPTVTENLTVTGNGVTQTVIDGQNTYRLFDFSGSGLMHTLRNLTVTNGTTTFGGGIRLGPLGSLTLDHVTVQANTATGGGGGIMVDGSNSSSQLSELIINSSTIADNISQGTTGGGGIAATWGSTVTITDSTISGNQETEITNGFGGGVLVSGGGPNNAPGKLTVIRSTISGNSTNRNGGGIIIGLSGTSSTANIASAYIQHSTISGNHADQHGGGIFLGSAELTMENSIVAANTIGLSGFSDGLDIYKSVSQPQAVTSAGHNLVGSNSTVMTEFPGGSPNLNQDIVGTYASPINPQLATLQDNGGPTQTQSPTASSPLVDQGSCAAEVADQRGYHSPSILKRTVDLPAIANAVGGDGCDIGSVEYGAVQKLDETACYVTEVSGGNVIVFCL